MIKILFSFLLKKSSRLELSLFLFIENEISGAILQSIVIFESLINFFVSSPLAYIFLHFDKINLADNSCDIVTAISLIEHIHQPKNFLSEVKRVLKKNKYFVIVTPDWSSNMKNFFDDPTHLHPYSRKSLKFLLESNGFRNIKILPWLVCKPAWMWKVPFSFFLAKIIPFRGDASSLIPQFLKGKSKTILAICTK